MTTTPRCAVSQQGSVRWRGERTFISEVFAYERLGLRALDDRTVEVLYGAGDGGLSGFLSA